MHSLLYHQVLVQGQDNDMTDEIKSLLAQCDSIEQ